MPAKSLPTHASPSAVIVEDEITLRNELKEAILKLWPELRILAEVGDGHEAMRSIMEYRPQVVFLDIQIPGPSGLEIARRINGSYHVVFVTAYDIHAISAFEEGALDYLLKPIDITRLSITIDRLKQRIMSPPINFINLVEQLQENNIHPKHLRWITASVGNSLKFITVDSVIFFQADGKYTRVVLKESEALITKPLKDLLEELSPDQFWQIHRSTIVNLMEVSSLEQDYRGKSSIKLKNHHELLPVSEAAMRKFRQL